MGLVTLLQVDGITVHAWLAMILGPLIALPIAIICSWRAPSP